MPVNPNQPGLSPSNDPNFLSWSRGISVPETLRPLGQANPSIVPQGAKFEGAQYEGNKHVDQSAEYAGRAAEYSGKAQGIATASTGNLIQELSQTAALATKGVDAVIKEDIDNTTYQAVDREREGFKAGLEAASGTKPTKMDVLSADDQANIPEDVENVGETVGNLAAAKAAGKISPTMYYMRLDKAASEIRNRYPGYREYIDKEIAKVSGVDPANAYIKSLMLDINRAQAASASAQNKTVAMLNHAISNHVTGAAEMKQRFLAGKTSAAGVDKFVEENRSIEGNLGLRAAMRADNKGTQDEQDRVATQDAYYEGTVEGYKAFNTITMGMDTTKKISDFVDAVASGKATATDEQMDQLAPMIIAAKQQAVESLMFKWKDKEGEGPDARSRIQKLGGPAKARQVAEESTQMFDKVYDRINNKDYGGAFSHMRANEAVRKDADYGLLNDPDLKKYTRLMSAIEKYPEYAKKFFMQGLRTDMDAKFNTKFNTDSADLQSQQDFRKTGVPSTVGKKMAEMTGKGVDPNSPQGKKYFSNIVNLPTLIGDKNTPDEFKEGMIHAAFSDNTAITQVSMDGRDPNTGLPIKGKSSVFQAWTAPDIQSEVLRLDALDPSKNLFPKYRNWVESTFNTLTRQETADLNTFQVHPDMKVTYDNQTNHFGLEFGAGINRPLGQIPTTASERALQKSPIDRDAVIRAQDSIGRLNKNIDAMVNMAKASNEDPERYILKAVMGPGRFDPSIRSPQGIPAHMIQAIKKSMEQKEPVYR